ncbi:hypothetical protein SESBI_40087, partial [Sesbania bispinosa]
TSTNEEDNGPKENQDSQESFKPMEKEVNLESKTILTATKSGYDNQESDDVGVYGPWMLVKKVPRKKHPGKIFSGSNPQKNTQFNNPEVGTRFVVLQHNEDHEADQNLKISNSEEQLNSVGQSTVTRIRDPKAGKNPQNFQEKKESS